MPRELVIDGHRIADDTDAWVIAEIGHNHGGSFTRAMDMVSIAASCGVDAVKLQKRNNKALYTPEFYAQPYHSENAYGPTYGEHREALEFSWREHYELALHANRKHVAYFATPFDQASADDLIARVGVPVVKIASSDIVNLDLLEHVAQYQRPMILSTGAASEQDVDRAVDTVYPINSAIALLQCTAAYPAPPELLNLNVIKTYRSRYPELVIGLSSHYDGISDAVAAYVLGARIIEKHFTLSRSAKGTDHAFSLQPAGLAKMVSYLRKTRLMLGSGKKIVMDEEQGAIDKMRRSTKWWAEREASAVR